MGSYTGSNSLEGNPPGGNLQRGNLPGENVLGQFSRGQPSRRKFVDVVESIELRLSVKCFNETDFHASLLAQ